MARLLIVGCGYVGSVLAESRVAAGDDVFSLRRSDATGPAGVEPLRADVTRPIGPGVLPDSIDAVVYAVAAKTRDEAVYRAAYVDGLAHVIDGLAASTHGRPRVIFTSSTAVYGQSGGEWVDESSVTEPAAFNGRILLEAEALLDAAPVESCSLRLGGIYGPGRTSRLRAVASGEARVRTGPPHYTNRIHRDDAAGALSTLLDITDLPSLVVGVDDEPVDEATLADGLAALVGAPKPPRVAPESAPAPRAGSKRCRNTLLRRLGTKLRYPTWREGYGALVAELDGGKPEHAVT